MFFPDEVVEEIQQRVNIVEIISNYFPLKKAGNLFKALCPFHQEKTPSFIVNPQRQIFHCFGCGTGGNVFSFLMKQENISFPEAVEILAKQAGIDISQTNRNIDKKCFGMSSKLYEINEIATAYYQNNLLNEKRGRVARRYLKDRQISSEVISKFRIGYAPPNGLLDYLQKRDYQKEILVKAGLIVKKEDGFFIDKFINKIIFPLFNPQGKVVGFGSRRLDNQHPKYINSPQTILFNKSRYLYGLNFARRFINKEVIIVEGYLDLIALFQSKIENVVASLGTALTREQISILKRYSKKGIIIYDGDKAGREASLRSLELFIEEGMSVGVVELPADLDPDDCLKKEGRERFEQRINRAKDFFDYKLQFLCVHYDKENANDLAKISKEMLSSLCKIEDAVLKDTYIKKLSQRLNIHEESLRSEIEKINRFSRKNQRKNKDEDWLGRNKISLETNSAREEKILLGLMLAEEKIFFLVKKNLNPQDFHMPLIQKIVTFLCSGNEKIEAIQLIERLRGKIEDLDSLISSSLNRLEVQADFNKKIATAYDCIKKIKNRKKDKRLQEFSRQIKFAEEKGDGDLASQLLEEYQKFKMQ